MSIFFHEQLYRTDAVMAKLKGFPVTICGAGALGANLAENLARTGFGKLKVIDDDVCDYPLARNLVMLTVAVACEAIVSFIAAGEERHFTITLKDLSVQSLKL